MAHIGFTGKAGSGKDVACKILAEEYGYEHRAFADPMREIMRRLNPAIGLRWPNHEEPDFVRWNDLPYHEAKLFNDGEGRRLMQVLGTEIGRDMFGENFWVDLSMRDADPDCCWSDVRFLNEAEAFSHVFGYVIRIERPGSELDGEAGQHASELEMDQIEPDVTIVNDGTLEEFQVKVRNAVEELMFDEVAF